MMRYFNIFIDNLLIMVKKGSTKKKLNFVYYGTFSSRMSAVDTRRIVFGNKRSKLVRLKNGFWQLHYIPR